MPHLGMQYVPPVQTSVRLLYSCIFACNTFMQMLVSFFNILLIMGSSFIAGGFREAEMHCSSTVVKSLPPSSHLCSPNLSWVHWSITVRVFSLFHHIGPIKEISLHHTDHLGGVSCPQMHRFTLRRSTKCI